MQSHRSPYGDRIIPPCQPARLEILVNLRQIWQRITSIYGERSRTTRYARALESEVARQRAENDQQRAAFASQQSELARLRAENRALLNSILGIAGIPPILQEQITDTPLPSSVSLPTKCHSESAAADDESRSTPSHHSSITAAEKSSPGSQSPRNDIPPNPQPESSSLRFPAPRSAHSSSPSPRRQLATSLRRRSWHQITRTLELESAKKPSPTS